MEECFNNYGNFSQNDTKKKKVKKKKRGYDFLDYAKNNGIKINLQYENSLENNDNIEKGYKNENNIYTKNIIKNQFENKEKETKELKTKLKEEKTNNHPFFNCNEDFGFFNESEDENKNKYEQSQIEEKSSILEEYLKLSGLNFSEKEDNLTIKTNKNYDNPKFQKNQNLINNSSNIPIILNQINNINAINQMPVIIPNNSNFQQLNRFQMRNQMNIPNNNIHFDNYGWNNSNYQNPQANISLNNQQIQYMIYLNNVIKLIELYFSFDFLNSDVYIRENIDNNGWIPIELMFSYNKIKLLRITEENIISAIQNIGSNVVEIKNQDNKFMIRNKNFLSIKDSLKKLSQIKAEAELKKNKKKIDEKKRQYYQFAQFNNQIQPNNINNQHQFVNNQNLFNSPLIYNQIILQQRQKELYHQNIMNMQMHS